MRTLAAALASQILIAAAISTGAAAAAKPEVTIQANRTGVVLASTDVVARLNPDLATGAHKAEIDVDLDAVQARLFQNTGVAADFSGSRLHYGRAIRSPYLLGIGVGDGFSTRLEAGTYSVTTAALSGPAGDSVAAELAALDGAMALQAGHRDTGRDTGSVSFAGAHVDFDLLQAELSLRWHVGHEEVEGGTLDTSSGGVAVGMSSILGEGDHLQAALSRPVRPDFGFDAPDLQVFYGTPLPVGRFTCTGGVQTEEQVSSVLFSWALRW